MRCHLCAKEATLNCSECGRGACADHIANGVPGRGVMYFCQVCADSMTKNYHRAQKEQADRYAAERSQRERYDAQMEARRQAQAVVNSGWARLLKEYECPDCEGKGWVLRRGLLGGTMTFAHYVDLAESNADRPNLIKAKEHYSQWYQEWTKQCPRCQGYGYRQGLMPAYEAFCAGVRAKGLQPPAFHLSVKKRKS